MPPTTHPKTYDNYQPLVSLLGMVALLIATLCGACTAILILPSLAGVLLDPEVNAIWLVTRVSGMLAYTLIWLSVLFGLLVTNQMATPWPGGVVVLDLHQFTSLMGLMVSLFHALILLADTYVPYTVWHLALPFTSTYRPLWVGVGQCAFYLLIPVTLSFYLRRVLGPTLWRLIHASSFLAFMFITLHSLLAGSDTMQQVVIGFYALTSLAVCFLTMYRMLTLRMPLN